MYEDERFNSIKFNDYVIEALDIKQLNTKVYALNIETIYDEIESFKNKMPVERYGKMMRYRNNNDKLLLIGNEILFQYGMKQLYPDIDISDIERSADAGGKPYIEGFTNIHFNMSHAGKYSLCAFSDKQIGVDIELIKEIDLSIAEKFYCKEEYNEIIKQTENRRYKKFYEYWVLKESFTKAVGLGLSIPLNVFQFYKSKENGLLDVSQKINQHNYICKLLSFKDIAYEVALCVQTS